MKTTKTKINSLSQLYCVLDGIYKEKGLRAVFSFLTKNGYKYERIVVEFGFGKRALQEKKYFLASDPFAFHYYSILKKTRSGLSFNLLRAVQIVFVSPRLPFYED